MSKRPKTRNKKYQRRYCSFAAPYLNRQLHPVELSQMHREIDAAMLKLKLGSLDPMAHRILWSFIGFGYFIADNFEQAEELKAIYLKGAAAIDRAIQAIVLGTIPAEEDLRLINEAVMYATDEISTIDVFNLQKLENYFIRHATQFDRLVKKSAGAEPLPKVGLVRASAQS